VKENQHQAAVIKWSLCVRGKYPELKLLYHVPNERKCSAVEGANLKRAGVKRGVPDLCLPVARGKYHGLLHGNERRDREGKLGAGMVAGRINSSGLLFYHLPRLGACSQSN
jgi:hypothetical protein